MTEKEARRDLKKRVREMMMDSIKTAMKKIDHLQKSGADILGDHIRVTESNGPYLIPRDFIAAYAEEMKRQIGWVTKDPRDRERNKRIRNYELMM